MDSKLSGLKLYSLGIVKVDKSRNSDVIAAIPIEELSLLDGDIINNPTIVHKNSIPNKDTVVSNTEVTADNFITATWIAFGHSNRMTSPDVIHGETVMIFRYMDTDEYYWTTIFREPTIRRKETVVYGYGDLASGNASLNKDNMYYMKVSTHDKVVTLHTSKSDGEPFEYDVILDTSEGVLTIKDDVGNSISMDSRTGTANVTTTKDVVINTNNVTVNAATVVNINTPTLNVSNDLNVGGNVSIGGTEVVNGHATFNGGTSGDRI